MIKKNQLFLNIINGITDGLLIFVAYLLAAYIRFELLAGSMPARQFALTPTYLSVALVYSATMVGVYYFRRMYGSYRFKRKAEEIAAICITNLIGTMAFMAALYVMRLSEYSRLALIWFYVISTLLVVLKRMLLRGVLRHYRMLGYNQKHVIVVGNGHFASQYIRDVRLSPQLGITIDGYLSKTQKPELGKCLGSYEDLEMLLAKKQRDEVVVALEPHEVEFMKPVLAAADKEGSRISIIPFYNDYIPTYPMIDVIGQTKLINMRSTPLDNLGNAMLKRAIDIVGSLVLIFLTSPIMLITAIGVKLSSPGPILFCQERVGKDKKVFRMLKFRSMRVTGTEKTGWSTNRDPRKTKFGSIIRKCSIDELPQFFNVLIGEMSLIGPRPEVPFHVEHFKEEIPLYLVRQQVRPGITGWAQVNGLRGDTSIEERVKYDIWYIENWSFGLDLRILWKTAFGGMINNEKIKTENDAEVGSKSEEKV